MCGTGGELEDAWASIEAKKTQISHLLTQLETSKNEITQLQ